MLTEALWPNAHHGSPSQPRRTARTYGVHAAPRYFRHDGRDERTEAARLAPPPLPKAWRDGAQGLPSVCWTIAARIGGSARDASILRLHGLPPQDKRPPSRPHPMPGEDMNRAAASRSRIRQSLPTASSESRCRGPFPIPFEADSERPPSRGHRHYRTRTAAAGYLAPTPHLRSMSNDGHPAVIRRTHFTASPWRPHSISNSEPPKAAASHRQLAKAGSQVSPPGTRRQRLSWRQQRSGRGRAAWPERRSALRPLGRKFVMQGCRNSRRLDEYGRRDEWRWRYSPRCCDDPARRSSAHGVTKLTHSLDKHAH